MNNIALYQSQARQIKIRVFFAADCALDQGVGLCYEHGYIDTNVTARIATAAYGLRGKAVMLPRSDTVKFFAGVTDQAYSAVIGGQSINILVPGGDAKVKVAVSVTAGSNSDSDGHVQCQWDGKTVGGTKTGATISGKTLTLSSANFTSNSVRAGDVVYITAGTGPRTGGYEIASITSETILVLVNAPGDYAAGDADLAFVIITRVDSSNVPFEDVNASGVFIDATGYGKSGAYAMQSGTFATVPNLLLCRLEDGNDDTGVIA